MYYIVSNELYHHGILGQKWGVRRFQNQDGSLTAAGKKRYLREVNRKLGDEVYDKATQNYKKVSEYASKHGLHEDHDYVPEKGRKLSLLENSGITKEKASAMIKYSKMLDDATEKEEKYDQQRYKKLAEITKEVDLANRPKLEILDTDSKVTRKVKEDYNTMSDQEFKNKYSGSPETYKKRVDKYGDPYMNSPMAKFAKKRGWR